MSSASSAMVKVFFHILDSPPFSKHFSKFTLVKLQTIKAEGNISSEFKPLITDYYVYFPKEAM